MDGSTLKTLEVCFSPALMHAYEVRGTIVVLVDILRATSTICTALHRGVREIIPVESVAEAKRYKAQGYIVAGERDGKVLDFADFGNSPFNFMNDSLVGKSVVYSTTNGTKAIRAAAGCAHLVAGAYLNYSCLRDWLISCKQDILVYCSGWKDKFNLEDTLFAGALCAGLLESGQFATQCDAVHASTDLWNTARGDLQAYVQKAAHRHRLRHLHLDNVIEYCHTFDVTPVIPILKENKLISLELNEKNPK